MKIKVTIEETISQEFEVEVSSIENAYDEICEMYYNSELTLDNANILDANVGIPTDGEDSDLEWENIFH